MPKTYYSGYTIPDPRSCPEDTEEQPDWHRCKRCNALYFGEADGLCDDCQEEEE